jgi:NAD-reducing hydrogenase large subunit
VGPGGRWECIDGTIRFRASDGTIVADGLQEDDYADFLGEAVEVGAISNSPTTNPSAIQAACTGWVPWPG